MNLLGFEIKKASSSQKRHFRNAFTGANIGRLSADQPSYRSSVDWDLRAALPVLVARSRHLWQNNPYAKKFFRMLKTHVVGPNGIIVKNQALRPGSEELDVNTNKAVALNFSEWGKVGNCDVTGRLSIVDIQNLYMTTMANDGEVLIRKLKGFDNKWGYALQFIDTDCLDVTLNRLLPDGNIIKMGVELNKWNRPVAYWILQKHPGEYNLRPTEKQHERIPAEEIIHDFESERTNQTRGIPWMHAILMNLAMLGGALEAEVVAFRAAAAKMGLVTEPEGENLDGPGEESDDEDKDSDYSMVFDAQAGTFLKLPKGYEVTMFDPKHPNTTVEGFARQILKGTASGLGPSYPSLASDLEGVNYTSIRAGFLDERDFFRYLQKAFLCDRLLSVVSRDLLQMSMLTGTLKLSYSQIDRIYKPKFRPKTWAWVDPLKEISADREEIDSGLNTRTAKAEERGLDFEEDILRVLQNEKRLQEKYGVTFAAAKPNTAAPASMDEDPVMPRRNDGNGNGNGNGNNGGHE